MCSRGKQTRANAMPCTAGRDLRDRMRAVVLDAVRVQVEEAQRRARRRRLGQLDRAGVFDGVRAERERGERHRVAKAHRKPGRAGVADLVNAQVEDLSAHVCAGLGRAGLGCAARSSARWADRPPSLHRRSAVCAGGGADLKDNRLSQRLG